MAKVDQQRQGFGNGPGWRIRYRVVAAGLLFLAIPVLFLITASELTKAKGPQWLPSGFENSYTYLFNSLLLVKGEAPQHIDHPGTTTQVLGAMVLRASSLKSTDDLIESVVRDPERHIAEIHWTLLIITFLSVWIFPWITAAVLKNYWVGLLIQVTILFYQTLLMFSVWLCSDLMLVPFSIASVCFCCLSVGQSPNMETGEIFFNIDSGPDRSGTGWLIRMPLVSSLNGLVCALGIATKLTFFPLILISIFFCRSLKGLVSFLAAFALALGLALLPIYSQLPRLSAWTFRLGTHSGQYGSGAVGLPRASEYIEAILSLVQAEPLVAVVPFTASISVFALSGMLLKVNGLGRRIAWQAVGLFALQALSFFLIAKLPGENYLIPLCLTTGLNLVLLFYVCRMTRLSPIKRMLGWIALIGLLILSIGDFVALTPRGYAELRRETADELRLYKHAQEITKNDVRIDYYFSDSPEYPLCFGDDYARRVFAPLLAGIYPKALFFNIFTGQFETFAEFVVPLAELQKHDHLYFLGDPQYLPTVEGLDPKTFETIDHAGEYYLQKWTRK